MKTYKMVNKENGVTIECSEPYVVAWLARGFEVDSIENSEYAEKYLENVISGIASHKNISKLDVL